MNISTNVDVDIHVDEDEMIEALESEGYIVIEPGEDAGTSGLESLSYDLIEVARSCTNPLQRDAYLLAAQMATQRGN